MFLEPVESASLLSNWDRLLNVASVAREVAFVVPVGGPPLGICVQVIAQELALAIVIAVVSDDTDDPDESPVAVASG